MIIYQNATPIQPNPLLGSWTKVKEEQGEMPVQYFRYQNFKLVKLTLFCNFFFMAFAFFSDDFLIFFPESYLIFFCFRRSKREFFIFALIIFLRISGSLHYFAFFEVNSFFAIVFVFFLLDGFVFLFYSFVSF